MNEQEIKNCPICAEIEKIRGTLTELKYTDSEQNYYTCALCECLFDYNDKTPCCKTYGTMISQEGVDDMRQSVIVHFCCLNCGNKYK